LVSADHGRDVEQRERESSLSNFKLRHYPIVMVFALFCAAAGAVRAEEPTEKLVTVSREGARGKRRYGLRAVFCGYRTAKLGFYELFAAAVSFDAARYSLTT
jgi:hypothetical protein